MKYLTNNVNILYLYLLIMGASSSVDEAQFKSLQNTVNSQASKINALSGLESKLSDVSKAAASAIDYKQLAEAINKESNYRENLAVAIAKNPNDLGANLAAEIGKNNSIIENLNNKLAASTTLQDKVADTLSSNEKYKERIRGPKGVDGSIGDKAALKSNLFDAGVTLWCADGEICKLPPGKTGIQIGKWVIQQHPNTNLHIHEGNIDDWSAALSPKQLVARDGLHSYGGRVVLGGWHIQQHPNQNLHIHQGDLNNWSAAVTTHQLHSRGDLSIHSGNLHGGNNVVKVGDPIAIRSNRQGGAGLVQGSDATGVGAWEQLRIERR